MLHQFQSLDQFLIAHQAYWRIEPFFASRDKNLPWLLDNAELCRWLASLTSADIDHFKQDTASLTQQLEKYLPDLSKLEPLIKLPKLALSGLSLERGVDSGIPGRKLDQILSMGEAALESHQGSEWLEWCSGKGFLGRILASKSEQKVTSFEYQQQLCDSGQLEANKQYLPMQFVQGDALDDRCIHVFNPEQHAVALHACGDLHVSLMTKGVASNLPAMTISPCCYHLVSGQEYQPLSTAGNRSALTLSKQNLRIPLQETVTGGERVKRHRIQEMSFRLGFDLLLREECNLDDYCPVPSIKKSQLADGFEAFCHWAAEKKALSLPQVDFAKYARRGEERFWHMERISLVQQVFRRALELWLVLDKSLYLVESGYRVSLSEFCSRKSTPRNILIHAESLGINKPTG